MTDQPTETTAKAGPNPTLGLLLALVLIVHFAWNFLVPAHEYPLRTEQVLTMTFDLGMIIGLFGFRRVIPAPLFWIALVAGIGLFAFRLSEDGWWTGHFVYTLPPR
jgi:cyanate permease